MAHYAVTAIGRDRPGIVAAIAEALLDLNGNIEDSRMAILGGHFSVMLVVSLGEDADETTAAARLEPVASTFGLEAIAVNRIDEIDTEESAPTQLMSVYGADHPGIVHTISRTLALLAVNITDLSTQLAGDPEAPIYLLVMELGLGGTEQATLEAALEEVASVAQVEVSLRTITAEAL